MLSEIILAVILFVCYRIEITNSSQRRGDEKIKKNTAAKYIKALPENFPKVEVELIKQKTEE